MGRMSFINNFLRGIAVDSKKHSGSCRAGPLRAGLLIATLLAAVLAGCGGSDSPPPPPPIVVPPVVVPPPAVSTSTTFLVTDTAGAAMPGATVYAIRAADVAALATQPITLTSGVFTADAQKVDEPLEDLINGNYTPAGGGVATYMHAVADAAGKAVITDLPAGASDKYFIYVKPGNTDTGHLPGGSLTRAALAGSALVSKETAIKMSTMPTAAATYIGSSLCILCHQDYANAKQTLHKLGIMVPKAPSGLQDLAKFSSATDPDQNFYTGLTKFDGAGTTLYYYGYSGGASGSFKVKSTDPRITDPSQVVLFTIYLSKSAAGVYQATFANLVNPADPLSITRPVSLSYGGGLHKQRYLTLIGKSNYILPLQFNPQGSNASTDSARYEFVEYDTTSKKWWNGTTSMFIDPNTDATGKYKSFDSFCAGCHYTGFNLTKNSNDTYTATAAFDYKGEKNPESGQLQELNVGCESCHGPGSEHLSAGGKGKFIITPKNITPEREVQICASCHTRSNSNDMDAHKLENPLDKNNKMPMPGISRANFLANNVVSQDSSAYWADGKHNKKHHMQAADFIQTAKYRNGTKLMTCASCHDVHAPGTDRHQLSGTSNNTLCLSCHESKKDLKVHMVTTTNYDMGAGTLCIQCHVTKTAKSGSGSATTTFKSPSGQEYFQNDISSHLFDVPLYKSVSASNKMPVPFTQECGICHNAVRLP